MGNKCSCHKLEMKVLTLQIEIQQLKEQVAALREVVFLPITGPRMSCGPETITLEDREKLLIDDIFEE